MLHQLGKRQAATTWSALEQLRAEQLHKLLPLVGVLPGVSLCVTPRANPFPANVILVSEDTITTLATQNWVSLVIKSKANALGRHLSQKNAQNQSNMLKQHRESVVMCVCACVAACVRGKI